MKLYPHQQQSLDNTKDFNRVAYYLDMGIGKTFVGSEKMVELGSNLNILVCQKSLIPTWVQHFKTYYPEHEVYDCSNKGGLMCFTSCASMVHNGQFKMIGVINYDLVFRRSYIGHITGFTLLLDESQVIQNGLTSSVR